ncbi:unnamed protein product [Lactuca saligna]|uniref:Uncharacterized protein n=1 Tax=Lactuca saligna TaxID=75948 RepID=A0AA35UV41_LACSI|nr:unnamed protein product [Lactuca saligna]
MGVSESFTIPKQAGESVRASGGGKVSDGGNDHEEKPKSNDLKDNVALTSRGKEKMAEEREKAVREVEETLKPQKNIFPLWSMERILNEAIDNPKIYWLEPVGSFELENSLDSQLDLPTTLKAFQFRSFDKIVNASIPDHDIDQVLFWFYLKHMKPQYKTWTLKNITAVKVFGPIETEIFINARFKVARWVAISMLHIALVDLPCLNPFDWILGGIYC